MPPRKRAGDLTGIETERLQKENAAALRKRAEEISMMAEVEAEESLVPIDYSNGPAAPTTDEIETNEVELETPTKVIIPNTSLESVTYGAGNHYSFEEGKRYTVPTELARHLSSKGLLWEGGYR